MQLLYVWIEEYNNIKEQGFSFSSEFFFTYEKGVLTIEDNPNYIPEFFGKGISNVTAVVGKNGSGKSSLLKQYLLSHAYNDIYLYFYIYAYEGKLIAKTSEWMSIQNNPNNVIQFEILDDETEKKRPFPIYYSPFLDFDHSVDNSSGSYSDLSLSYLIQHEQKQDASQFEAHRYLSLRRWIEYSNIKKDSFIDSQGLYIKLNRSLDVRDSNLINKYWNLFKYDGTNNSVFFSINQNLLNDLLYGEINQKLRLKLLFLRQILRQFFHYLSVKYEHNIHISDSFLAKTIPSIAEEHIEYVKEFFKEQNWINEKNAFIDYLNFVFECIDEANQWHVTPDNGFSIMHDKAIKLLDFDYKIISLYRNALKNETTFNANSLVAIEVKGISSGEKAMIQLFSCINSVPKVLNENEISEERSICILIDEGEIGFHPQWQKEYLNLLLTTLPKIFEGKKLQIILTSHSPFLISDLPKQNVIFMDNGKVVPGIEKQQTFGQNIHTLLADGFFLEDGLMGDFAKGKIQEVIDWLREDKISESVKDIESAKKVINLIGEPLLKFQLNRKLEEKAKQNKDLYRKYLESELAKLDEK